MEAKEIFSFQEEIGLVTILAPILGLLRMHRRHSIGMMCLLLGGGLVQMLKIMPTLEGHLKELKVVLR